MTSLQAPESKPRRRWYQFRLRTIFIVFAVVAVVLGTLSHYRVHIIYWCFASRQNFTPVPVVEMPRENYDGWVRCRFGKLEFSLPPEMAVVDDADPKKSDVLLVGSESRKIILFLPSSCAEFRRGLSETGVPPCGRDLSPIEFRLAVSRLNSDDASWLMSRDQLHWHCWLESMATLSDRPSRVETLDNGSVEGLLIIGKPLVYCEWYHSEADLSGTIVFRDEAGIEECLPWARAFCASLAYRAHSTPVAPASDTAAALFEVLEAKSAP